MADVHLTIERPARHRNELDVPTHVLLYVPVYIRTTVRTAAILYVVHGWVDRFVGMSMGSWFVGGWLRRFVYVVD